MKTKPSPSERWNAWLGGYACALANLNRLFDRPTCIEDTLKGDGITLAQLEAAGADGHDLDELRKCVRQPARVVPIRRPRRRHSMSSQVRCALCAPCRCKKAS